MTGNGADALGHALELHAKPGALALLRRRPLPDAVLLLIRIAAGDRQAIEDAAARTSVSVRKLTDAAVMYLRQVLFDADADHYRLLGVRADASEEALKEHYRWLMRWLHPDRDPDRTGEADAQRVNRAWHVLRSGERRLAYDRQRAQQAAQPVGSATSLSAHRHASASRIPQRPPLSPRTVRHLPVFVLGGLALLAGGSLAGWHWLNQTGEANVATLRSLRTDAHGLTRSPAAQASMMVPSQRIVDATTHAVDASAPIARPDARASESADADPVPPAHAVPWVSMSTGNSTAAAPQRVVRRATALPDPAQDSVDHATADRSEADLTNADQASADQADADRAYTMIPDRLAAAYGQGNLEQLMRLFASDAVDDRGGIATIASEYRSLFRQTRSRRLRMGTLSWRAQDGHAVGTGTFDARVRRRGHPYARHVRGNIVIEAASVDAQWKIERISLRGRQR